MKIQKIDDMTINQLEDTFFLTERYLSRNGDNNRIKRYQQKVLERINFLEHKDDSKNDIEKLMKVLA